MREYDYKAKSIFCSNLTRILSDQKRMGRSAKNIASDLGISPKKLSDWKNGAYLPSGLEIDLLCHYFRVDEKQLFYTSIDFFVDTKVDQFILDNKPLNNMSQLSPEAQELLKLYNQMSIKERTMLLFYAYKLTGGVTYTEPDVEKQSGITYDWGKDKMKTAYDHIILKPEEEKTEL